MTKQRDDQDIADRFRGLREETERAGGVPDFQAMMDRARAEVEHTPPLQVVDGGAMPGAPHTRRRRVLWMGGAASAALAAAVAGLLFGVGGPSPDEEFDRLIQSFTAQSAGAWLSPTSRLLDVPGMEMIRTVPSLGRALPGPESGDRSGAPGSEGRESRS